MPLYEYVYENEDGQRRVVERRFKMGKAPKTIMVDEADACYEAVRIISLTAKQAINWQVRDTASDLPPENAPLIE